MRVLNGIFIAIFMAMLMLPLIFVDFSQDRVSVQENRMLANLPQLIDIKEHPETFVQDLDAWFKDSTGFREQLIGFYNMMAKNTWFNSIWLSNGKINYLVGKQGHYYFASLKSFGDLNSNWMNVFQGKKILPDNQLANMAVKLEEVKTYLDRKGVPMIIMFNTMKEFVYPEFYPELLKRGPEPIPLDVITQYLQENTSVDVFNIRQALLAEKNNYMLYEYDRSHGDLTHYNEIGAFFAYRELMRHINIYFPEITPYELSDIVIDYDTVGMPHISLKKEKKYKRLDASFFDGISLSDLAIKEWIGFNEAYENIESDLPVILFLRTSFSAENYIGKYIANHFGRVIMLHFEHMEHIEEYIDRFKPDIVVFETVDRLLDLFAAAADKIPPLP